MVVLQFKQVRNNLSADYEVQDPRETWGYRAWWEGSGLQPAIPLGVATEHGRAATFSK